MKVEVRKVAVDELPEFDEVGACGTAAVISPIGKIVDMGTQKVYEYCKGGEAGSYTMKLYNHLTGIQQGDIKDTFGWVTIVE
jgi:branched-chain amino acid aminotransferase